MKSKTILFCTLVNTLCFGMDLKEKVREYKFPNGLKLLFVERKTSPTFTGMVLFLSGRADEPEEKGGLAHLVEHMMFKGTKTIGTKNYEKEKILLSKIDSLLGKIMEEEDSNKIIQLKAKIDSITSLAQEYVVTGEIGAIFEKHGSRGLNAATGMDATSFVVSLPKNKLELWVRVIADIIENTVWREFYKEKEVIINEINLYKDEPQSKFSMELLSLAFKIHPYGKPLPGEIEEVKKLRFKDVEKFWRTHYVMSNCIITIVGDLHWEDVKECIAKYFSHFPNLPPPTRSVKTEPPQKEERRKIIELEAEPQLAIAYHIPTYPHFDAYVVSFISQALSEGRTSRLYRRMVETKKASSVTTGSGFPSIRYPNLFVFRATPISPTTPQQLEKKFYQEIEKIKKQGLTKIEFAKIKNQLKVGFIRSLQSNESIVWQLAFFEGFFGGWEKLLEYFEIIEKITNKDVKRVAKKYFTKTNRIVIIAEKKEKIKTIREIVEEYYEEKYNTPPPLSVKQKITETLAQLEEMEKTQGTTIPRETKIQILKQVIEKLGGKK